MKKEQADCASCWAYKLAERTYERTTDSIKEIRLHYPELELVTLDEIVDSVALDRREQNTPIKYELFRSVVRRQVATDFLIDASQECPGLTEYRIIGVPFHTTCGMTPERTEELKNSQ